ncbi:hypothetical protein CLOSTMETH_01443 [[Clostridium] methylpentosum DSM 5476]|uniref:Uncharacterized protein n=1 Tax=[Clostridium] methylpentosum DSM 5476 TaxID=537013 RepID=C0EC74_9FIRM|nr:hypothetical protein CLOSTMETH_01443 [[Clostridium] methylpentosum DSM 5476]
MVRTHHYTTLGGRVHPDYDEFLQNRYKKRVDKRAYAHYNS